MYLVLVYAAIFIFRKIDWRNFVIPLIGIITPVFLSYAYLLAFDDLERFNNLWILRFDLSLEAYNSSHFLLPLAFIGIMADLGYFSWGISLSGVLIMTGFFLSFFLHLK